MIARLGAPDPTSCAGARANGARGFEAGEPRVRRKSSMQVRSSITWLLAASCAVGVVHSRAYAFGDPFRFIDSVEMGGGGGRWFTSSPADGYGCEVCHAGPPLDQLVVMGLPERYAPGATYDLLVTWPAAMQRVTAAIELTDQLGRGAGKVQLSPTLTAAESCEPVEDGVPAAMIFEGPDVQLADDRQIVVLQDCGASALHWQWTAPPQDVGPVYFSGGVVWPDQRRDARGDRTSWFLRPIVASTQTAYTSRLAARCALAHSPGAQGAPAGVAMLGVPLSAIATFRLSRRARARSRRALT